MTPTIDEMNALCEKATPGPWRSGGPSVIGDPVTRSFHNDDLLVGTIMDWGEAQKNRVEDAAFIAAARTWVPQAIERIGALESFVERVQHMDPTNPEAIMREASDLKAELLLREKFYTGETG